jgi:hypothetical protein
LVGSVSPAGLWADTETITVLPLGRPLMITVRSVGTPYDDSLQSLLIQVDRLSRVTKRSDLPQVGLCACAEMGKERGVDPYHHRRSVAAILRDARDHSQLVLTKFDIRDLGKSFLQQPTDFGLPTI